MRRRDFLQTGLACMSLAACDGWRDTSLPPVTLRQPGLREGHFLRDARDWPQPSGELQCEVAILGSGVAGISAAWKLAREGLRDFVLLSGPEAGGNTAGGEYAGWRYPTGAHYLPLPSLESLHVREMLHDIGVLLDDPRSERPSYDERVLVHPLQERLYDGGQWHDELLPAAGMDAAERVRFLDLITRLRTQKGRDGRRLFSIPAVLSSTDPEWRALDEQSFRSWLQREGFHDDRLHWYADYCCRDDYGAGAEHVSAWAGLHYFASRAGEAANAEPGSVLTWPDGLHVPLQALRSRIPFGVERGQPRWLDGFALRARRVGSGGEVIAMLPDLQRSVRIRARKLVLAMPLHVSAHVLEGMPDFGFDLRRHAPPQASWMIANYVLKRFPSELGARPVAHGEHAVPLAWDNVLRAGRGLGYVVSTHQLIRVAKPEKTVFTAYKALPFDATHATRSRLLTATAEELLAESAEDLLLAYGPALWPLVERVEITLRGHAMSVPVLGFLSNAGLAALRAVDGPIRFAHSDLSGYSVFEEAAWWGVRAAEGLL